MVKILLNHSIRERKPKVNPNCCNCNNETSISNGELYTIVTNKAAKDGRGSLVAMIEGTKTSDISAILIFLVKYHQTKENRLKRLS